MKNNTIQYTIQIKKKYRIKKPIEYKLTIIEYKLCKIYGELYKYKIL